MEPTDLLLDYLGLDGTEKGDRQVRCPFHDDSNASASINLEKGVMNCFTCNKGWKLEQVEQQIEQLASDNIDRAMDLAKAVPMPSNRKAAFVGYDLAQDAATMDVPTAAEYLAERGLEMPDGIKIYVDDGYLHFGPEVARNLGPDTPDRPRYRNAPGMKGVFWVNKVDGPVWLTEGVIDALTLSAVLGSSWAVAATLGSSLTDRQAYNLRDRTVFVAYDADHAGYTGARKAAEKLSEFNANPIILDFDEDLGKDINEGWLSNPDGVREWVRQVQSQFSTLDVQYVDRLFSGDHDDLLTLSTGLDSWDGMLGGGFRPGVHTIGAETGVGKSSWLTHYMVLHAEAGKRVLGVSYELPKRQMWARIAARKSKLDWQTIEATPELVEDSVREWVSMLARNLRLVSGWSVPKIKFVAEHYDTIAVDYLQRMPGPFKGDSTKQNIDYNISELSDLGRDQGKVIVAISSMNRSSYGGDISRKDFKESGNIEFVSQSLTGFKREGASDLALGSVVKNTRGREGKFYMKVDLAHQTFADADAPWAKNRKPKGGDLDSANALLKGSGVGH